MQIDPTASMIFLDVLMIIYTLWLISSLNQTKSVPWLGIGVGLLSWLAVVHWVIGGHRVFDAKISGLNFWFIILASVALVGILLFSISPVRRVLLGLTQQQLLGLQGIRVFFGAGFLVQASTGVLPQAFGIIDGLTHISAGFFGLIAAFSWSENNSPRVRAWFANLFGLADILIVATTLAFILLPQIGPHHSMMYAVFLPAPLWLWFHLVSIWKLVNDAETNQEKITASCASNT